MAVLKTKLERAGYSAANLSVGELRRALKKGQEYADNQEWELALPHLLKAWDAMPEDLSLLTILSFALSQLGVRDKAIMVLERTLAVHGATSEICSIMLTLSLEMGMHDVGRKLCLTLIEMEPQVPNHYVNLATAYSGLDMYDESIEMLQSVLPLFPNDSNLWNVLATQVRSRDGVEAANVFFEEAIRLNPNDFKIFSNYGQSFLMAGDYERALENDLRSIELNPESSEPRLGAAQMLFYMGRFEEAWKHYAFRLSSRRKLSQSQIYTHGIDLWEGQPLKGKTILIAAEQ
ncbi:MAG: tetratricopeptide repeat protein, partial [Kordiimonadaceae bacterium]|nr:tetratricopeptide repeat protein [Kordiimonadaceae bacterium]